MDLEIKLDEKAKTMAAAFLLTEEQGREWAGLASDECCKVFTEGVSVTSCLNTLISGSDSWQEASFKIFQFSASYGANKMANGAMDKDEVSAVHKIITKYSIKKDTDAG